MCTEQQTFVRAFNKYSLNTFDAPGTPLVPGIQPQTRLAVLLPTWSLCSNGGRETEKEHMNIQITDIISDSDECKEENNQLRE